MSPSSASSASTYASALHRRTHRVTSALAYAALEWTLIALLLLNGLLSHAVARFAAYFGLSPPCLLCARVDRLFGAEEEEDADEAAAGDARWLRGVLCGAHAAEISGMGYCLRHRRLVAEATDMCEGCLSSWSKEKRDGGGAAEEGATACSCCRALVEGIPSRATHPARENHPPVVHVHDKAEEEEDQGYVLLDQEDHEEEEQAEAEQRGQQNEDEIKVAAVEDESLEVMAQGEEITAGDDRLKIMLYWLLWITMAAVEDDESEAQSEEIVAEDDQFVPVVALDEIADDSDAGEGEDDVNRIDDLDTTVVLQEKRMLASSVAMAPATMENSIPQDEELVLEDSTVEIGDSRTEEEEIVVPQVTEAVSEDCNRSAEVETNCEVSIGSDICEQEQDGRAVPFQELVALEELFSPLDYADDRTLPLLHEASRAEQEASEIEQRSDYLSNDQIENDQDRAAPETPTYSFTTQNSGRRFLLERKLSLSLSMDGSVSSEIEGGEPLTIDLQTERKALSAMYSELEEERNAAAIATNQTMAMINRLQEEKAAMQMEALQYQRMMEEQSEYDQEAMQLLTELVTKREREKQELERELELCKQKLLHYEDKERRRMATFNDNGNGTSASSSDEDSDEHSDDDCELGESPDGDDNLQSSPDAALSPRTGQENTSHLAALDDSLTYFEMERLSILDELKTLEERLFTLEDDDTSVAPRDHSSDHYLLSTDGIHSPQNGLTGGNKAKFEGRGSVSRGKSLLPLFDAVGEENRDRTSSAEADDSTKPVAVFAKEQERLAIIEEVDHVYERLQALEADKEFLRHCIKSLKTGDKGMYLLQEILQHLRELRNVELHVKNAGGGIAVNSA